jgi:hypothetical protein
MKSNFVKKQNKKAIWINFFSIVCDIEEEMLQYVLNSRKLTLFLFIMSAYWHSLFHDLNLWQTSMMRGDLFYEWNITGVGTTDGTYPIHVCYKQVYFHFECGNLNVSIWLGYKTNNYGIMYSLLAIAITYVLQLSKIFSVCNIVTYMYSNHGI